MIGKKYNVVRTNSVELGRFKVILDTIVQDEEEYPYSYIHVKNSVAVLVKKGEHFIFIKQYRHSVNKEVLEIPGGAIEDDEDPLSAAKREVLEEIGYQIKMIEFLGSFYPTVGISDEKCFLFYAECGDKRCCKLDPLEKITISYKSNDEIQKCILNGELMHSMALIAWLKYKVMKSAN